jgi:hypothetical protein
MQLVVWDIIVQVPASIYVCNKSLIIFSINSELRITSVYTELYTCYQIQSSYQLHKSSKAIFLWL